MGKIALMLGSRTVWTIAAMFLIGGIHAITQFIPAGIEPVIELILGGMATYFHLNPSQNYNA